MRAKNWLQPLLISLMLLLCSCGSGVYHPVKPGQTLYRISKAYGLNEAYLARINGIRDPTRLRAGTELFIPGARQIKVIPPVRQSSVSRKPSPPTKKVQTRRQPTLSPRTKAPPAASKSVPAAKLHWPLRGKIVRTFNATTQTGGGRGIEIAVRAGSQVSAAEAGKVIYSGNGIKGYGQLIILQHENDLFTIYGFNQRNLVRQGDFVSQGEKIALSGTPPSGGTPRLHFEVRKGKQPVNPILYLP